MSEVLNGIVAFVLIMAAAYGMSYWAYRACTDRAAFVGLDLVFGIPGLLLIIAGLAVAATGRILGPILLATGLGLSLPLLRPVRDFVARVTPMDPASAIDMTGLCLMLGLIGLLGTSLIGQKPTPPSNQTAVSVTQLVAQVLAEVGLAFAAVGWLIRRDLRKTICRLGLTKPTWRTIAVAIGVTILVFVVNALAGYLTEIAQPHVYKDIEQVTKQLTSGVQNPAGALLLGLSAGIGEELLLRGALQPRYGIILTSILFALLHTQYGYSIVVAGLFGTGILLGLERKYYGTTAAIITHALFDTLVVLAQTAR